MISIYDEEALAVCVFIENECEPTVVCFPSGDSGLLWLPPASSASVTIWWNFVRYVVLSGAHANSEKANFEVFWPRADVGLKEFESNCRTIFGDL